MQVWSLGQEDPLEKEIATHSSILVWEILWTEDRGGIQSMGSQESDMMQGLNQHHQKALLVSDAWGKETEKVKFQMEGGLSSKAWR